MLDSPASTSALADAPAPAAPASNTAGIQTMRTAGHYDKYILPGQPVPRLDFHDKFLLGLKDATSLGSIQGWVSDAAYSHLINSAPHFGSNRDAFAQRFGASAARDFSEGVLGDSILAPILHEDPRYYIAGPSHSLVYRAVYASTRSVITRRDDGRAIVNLSNLGGNFGGAVLTNLYYPPQDRSVLTTGETFAGSVGGSALGFILCEFFTGLFSHQTPTTH